MGPLVRKSDGALSDPERLEELRSTGLLETRSVPTLDALTSLAQRLLRVPVATVSLVDEDYQRFISYAGPGDGPGDSRMPIANSFCRYAVATGEPFMVTDARKSPLLTRSVAARDLGVVSYAGAPLETSRGQVLGTLCVLGTKPREWSGDDEQLLSELAAIAATEIEYRTRTRAMARIETFARELHEPVELLGDSVRGLVADLDGDASPLRVDRLAARVHKRFSSIESLEQDLHEALRDRRRAPRGPAQVNLAEAVERAVRLASVSATDGVIDQDRDVGEVVAKVDSHLLQRALSHLVVSALHHSDDSRPVHVSLTATGNEARLMVHSPGNGMPARVLTSVVSRLDSALRAGAGDGDDPRPRSISLRGQITVAQAEGISAATGSGGTHVIVTVPVELDGERQIRAQSAPVAVSPAVTRLRLP